MVVAAYLAGLFTTPAALLGMFGGMAWWRRYRRTEADQELLHLRIMTPPPPPLPQESNAPVLNNISLRSVPGSRRAVRGKRPHRFG